jgi:hypothetical protein
VTKKNEFYNVVTRLNVVKENDLVVGMARIDSSGVKSGNVFSGKSALASDYPGHEEVLDGDERGRQGLVEQAVGHRRRKNVTEIKWLINRFLSAEMNINMTGAIPVIRCVAFY